MASQAIYALDASRRDEQGKGASRRLRRKQDQFPAVIYGGHQPALSIQIDQNKMLQALSHEGFYSHILTLNVDGKPEQVILKALQRHHYKKSVLHADFMRVSATDKVHMRIPLHFTNAETCPGAKAGGVINHQAIDVDVRCMASQIPEFIEVDLANLGLDESIHLSQLAVSKGVELVELSHGNDLSVVSVHLPRIQAEDLEAPAVAETEADSKVVASDAASPKSTPDKA